MSGLLCRESQIHFTTSGSPLSRRLHGLALLRRPHRTYSLTLMLPLLSGPSKSSAATLLNDVQGPEFLRIVEIVKFAKSYHNLPFSLLDNALVPQPADIQSNSVEWHRFRIYEPYFQGSSEKSVVGPGKHVAPKDPILDKSPATAFNTWLITFLAPLLLEYKVHR